ncbi:unnamed protein product [Lactuca saligna]|uniref:Uncharacterized protein n=1 Tax=Lactuca saligna TaxID=75948 RepID=A0AA35YR50_LACSI|nr:unnamed protein product [Lactuca saligna]
MAKRSLTEESRNDFRDKKRILISSAEITSHGFNDFCFSGDDNNEYEHEDCESSVGSNHPILDVILISDSEDDEVESPSSKIDITGDEVQETQTGITLFRSPAVAENQCAEIEVTEKKQKEGEEEEEGSWWMEFGSMIVDNNGFLLGEYRRLDEELYVNITADS